MTDLQRTISPIDGSIVAERSYASAQQVDAILERAVAAQKLWRKFPLKERLQICEKFAQYLLDNQEDIALEITQQMGRPISQTPSEVRTCADRALTMVALAPEALEDIRPEPRVGFKRFIRRSPLGVVYVIAPWNYPLLAAVNTVVPAIIAGNSVILKHAPQTPLSGERFAKAFETIRLPSDVFQVITVTNSDAERIIADQRIDYVAFTGSVRTGRLVQKAAANRFIGVGLELGGKDPAYIRADADVAFSVENIVDGAFFNSGQSCCGIERIYAHSDVYDEFIERAAKLATTYHLGNPLDIDVNLGPVVNKYAASVIREHLDEAIRKGARNLVPLSKVELDRPGDAYVSPRLLVDVDHSMRLMREETFGPVVGVMRVESDQQALELMNDSTYGLTASIWTKDVAAANALAEDLETGTVLLNRCDHLDPTLAWTGVKNSGRGATLSVLGYEHVTRPKSYHFRLCDN
ncbi:aldehyde dehydrogenase family protein [Rhizobium leguminosarum]|uniref:Aldehyde dehydrogenase n=2 Tax=Rhizobium TaxID=379 RepID=A0A179C093_RHILE|nr:aldehyde dehydrogenase family protein [Rhizobium leguminosarum]ANP89930.1 aldehyde dehydrogenase [Rhizobium leguminosarum]ANP90548.1 aldehyde dehydrogenase [Rhizobium leguminosarum]OAP97640.1 aldehyde dehydrogenase [Rhizobium leguminosarum]